MKKALIVSSPTCENDKTQSSLVYLATALHNLGIQFDILDLSGEIDYFDPPEEFFSPCDSEEWLSPRIFHEASWLDDYIPSISEEYDAVFYSALFSPDILVHGRHSNNQKKASPNCVSVIGGPVISCLNTKQTDILSEIFDYVCCGYDVEYFISEIIKNNSSGNNGSNHNCLKSDRLAKFQPNYGLLVNKPFITVYSGHGCNWGKCRFCNSAYQSNPQYYSRPAAEITHDFEQILELKPSVEDVMLSSDSFTRKNITEIALSLKLHRSTIPYNIMLRGEKWVSEELGELLSESGCTDVFIGAESLNDGVLRILNKGVNTENIINAVTNLSKNVKVILGLLLFTPGVTEKQLDDQLQAIEKVLPMVEAIEPEIMSVVQGATFADAPARYGIRLWATERTINDSWCYGLSPDIPWTFQNDKDADVWFKFYDKLRSLINDFVEPHYWNAIDYVQLRF
jgi:hypothetical protein